MSLHLKLLKNLSDTDVVSKYTEVLAEIEGTLKERTSILSPKIIISGTIPTTCNYFYIQEFARYYYIDDVVSVHNNVYEISGHVDVLKTYETQIKASTGIVARQENDWNLYVDDGSFKVYQNPKFKIDVFPSGFSTFNFVMAIAGNS